MDELDSKLFDISRKLAPYPQAINAERLRISFLNGDRSAEPNFEWKKESPGNLDEMERLLSSIVVPSNHPLKTEYQERIEELKLILKYKRLAGDKSATLKICDDLYGRPDNALYESALRIISNSNDVAAEKEKTAEELKERLEQRIAEYGIKDWQVLIGDKAVVTTYLEEKRVIIPIDFSPTESQIKRLIAHEIDTHVLSAANGYDQPYLIFAYGFAGYLETEEGHAMYNEILSGASENYVLRFHAWKVIAVYDLCLGKSFVETFDHLKKLGADDEDAWTYTYRAFRGGAFTKDYLYLSGYYKVKKWIENGGDANELYIGKIGINNLPKIRELLVNGKIRKPKILPIQINRTDCHYDITEL